jgi:phage-related protein
VLKYRENEGRNWLDNLKLGYGGTKGEMERLIADANKVKEANGEMADLSISSFADVTEAIHIIQTEMGITGTTSKEASETISGSVGAMKSSWQNLLTGIADDNANFNELVNNFVDSLVTALNNILPRVQVIFEGLGLLVTDLLNVLLEKVVPMGVELIQNLITGMQSSLPDIMASMSNAINLIISTIVSMLPQILQMGIQIIASLVQGLAQQLPTLIPQMVDTVVLMVDTLIDNIDLIIDAGIELLIGLSEGLIEALPRLIDKIPVIIDKLVNAIIRNLPKIIEMGITLTVKLAEGVVKAIPQLVGKIPEIMGSFIRGFGSFFTNDLPEIGKNIIRGIINGLTSCGDIIWKAVKSVGNSILDGVKGFFGIKSPSTLFRDQVGKNLALGLGEGFEDEMKEVTSDMQDALPTSLNTDLSVGSSTDLGTNNYFNMVEAFKEALTQVKIELDDEVAGRFVETTVTNAIYN